MMRRSPTRPRPLARTTLAVLAVVAGGACADLSARSPLHDARESPEALAQAALEALAAKDPDALAALVVSRDEYETLLWPELPDRNHVTFEFLWGMTEPRTRKARRNQMEDYGGLDLEVVRVELGEEKEAYEGFTLHKNCTLFVRNVETGEEGRIPLMDVLVEMDGGWKLLNVRDDF